MILYSFNVELQEWKTASFMSFQKLKTFSILHWLKFRGRNVLLNLCSKTSETEIIIKNLLPVSKEARA